MKKFFDERTICFSASSGVDSDKKLIYASSKAQKTSMGTLFRRILQASADKKICEHILKQDVKLVLKE